METSCYKGIQSLIDLWHRSELDAAGNSSVTAITSKVRDDRLRCLSQPEPFAVQPDAVRLE